MESHILMVHNGWTVKYFHFEECDNPSAIQKAQDIIETEKYSNAQLFKVEHIFRVRNP